MARSSDTTLLIDGDPLVYQFACGGHQKFDWGDEVVSEVIDLDKALERLEDHVWVLEQNFNTTKLIFALTDPEDNFRLDFFPEYKSNRRDLERPVMWADIRSFIETNYRTYLRPRLEGDDILGILATSEKIVKTPRKIIVAVDKDMKTIPGEHYNPDKDELFYIDEREADYWHLFQTLTGDPVDGYPGCPKIGPKRAAKAFEKCFTEFKQNFDPGVIDLWEQVVVPLYEAKGLTEEDALVQARCARILRASDYDFECRQPIWWRPT